MGAVKEWWPPPLLLLLASGPPFRPSSESESDSDSDSLEPSAGPSIEPLTVAFSATRTGESGAGRGAESSVVVFFEASSAVGGGGGAARLPWLSRDGSLEDFRPRERGGGGGAAAIRGFTWGLLSP